MRPRWRNGAEVAVLTILALVTFGYMLGSLPTSVAVGRLVGGIDVREHGSGNAGASNILRTLGLMPALLVLAVDILKGFATAWLGLPYPEYFTAYSQWMFGQKPMFFVDSTNAFL